MWRGSSLSTLLHAAVILLLLFGVPSLPLVVERPDEEPRTPATDIARPKPDSGRPAAEHGSQLHAIEIALVPESALAPPAARSREAPASPAVPGAATSPGASAASSADRMAEQPVPLDALPEAVLALDPLLQDAVRRRPPDSPAAERRAAATLGRLARAAARGHAHAEYNHAVLLLNGVSGGSQPDRVTALLERAAERGYRQAQMLLGWLAAGGAGRPIDPARADFWWSLAEQGGSKAAARARAMLKPHMTLQQMIEAQRRRAEWHRLMRLIAPARDADAQERANQMLREAAAQGDAARVAEALVQGADAEARDADGRSAIVNAAWRGREHIVALFLEHGVDADAADDRQRTALIWSAINGHLGVVERLLAAGADPDRRDADGATALIRAAWNGHPAVAERLLAAGARADLRDASGASALDRAREAGHTAIVRLLQPGGG